MEHVIHGSSSTLRNGPDQPPSLQLVCYNRASPVVPAKHRIIRPPLGARQGVVPRDGSDGNAANGFTCNYCQSVFSSSQALGGHQNAHKQERGAIAKQRRQGIELGVCALGEPPFSFLASALAGRVPPETLYRSAIAHSASLRMRHNSTIHKPKPYMYPMPLAGYRPNGRFGQSGCNLPSLTTFDGSVVNAPARVAPVSARHAVGLGQAGGVNQMDRPNEVIKHMKPEILNIDPSGIDLTLRLGISS